MYEKEEHNNSGGCCGGCDGLLVVPLVSLLMAILAFFPFIIEILAFLTFKTLLTKSVTVRAAGYTLDKNTITLVKGKKVKLAASVVIQSAGEICVPRINAKVQFRTALRHNSFCYMEIFLAEAAVTARNLLQRA